jgi:hypothetical protein
MSIIQDPAGAGAANVTDAESPVFTGKKALIVAFNGDVISGTVTANQGTTAALSGAWPVKITDGTNTLPTMDAVGRAGFQKVTDGTNTAAVKAASTAAIATDPALVVAISPNNSVAVTGTFWQATQPVSGTFWQTTQPVSGTFWQTTQPVSLAAAVDVSDRAGRLVGVVYGSQGQQIKQTATNYNLQVEIAVGGTLVDPRQVRALTSSDVVTAAQATAANLNATVVQGTAAALSGAWPVKVTDGTNSMPTMDVVGRAGFHKVTDGTNTAAVKAASTAAIATDPALVVAISPNNTVGVTGTFWQATQPVSGTFWQATQPVSLSAAVDVSDRAGRLVGVVYGSQGQQVKQTATNFNLQVEVAVGGTLVDPRSIRALTSSDVVTAAQATAANLNATVVQGTAAALSGGWPVKVTDGTNSMPTMDTVGRAGFHKITDGTNTAAVKAASTAAIATDPALVVAISPNNTVGVTGTFWQATQPVSGTVTAAQATAANLNATVVGLGSAGTPSGGVLSVQGVSGGQALPVSGSVTASGTVTSNQGTAAALAGGWPVKVTDGTNTLPTMDVAARAGFQKVTDGTNTAAVKAASTAAVATDPALVVAVSPNNTVGVTGTFWQTTQPVSGTFWQTTQPVSIAAAVDVSDRAARLVGVVYGSQGQQIKQTATNFNAAVELATGATLYDARQIRALTSADVVTAAQATAANLNATVVQGTAAAVAGAWPVKVTDGTNSMPTMDTVARSGYVRVTDGTNTQPTGDAAARRIYVQPTDGTNLMPMGDAVARAILQKITDGTNTAAVKAASTAAVAADPALVVTVSPNSASQGVGAGGWVPSTPSTFFGVPRGQKVPLAIGPDGTLQCYSEVLTDAGSFREDYPGSSLQSNLTGTLTFTNGSASVTATGGAFTTQLTRFSYIKLTGHADSVLASVLSVTDDNTLTLAVPYAGANGTGVGIVSGWFNTVGTGGSITVATSNVVIASGTTNGSNNWVQRGSDYAPMEKTIRFNVSQRIANQTVRLGWFDSFTSPTQQACIELTGTDNTQVSLVCRSSSAAADVETVTATLPSGINTGTALNLKIDFHPDRVSLYYDPADGSEEIFLAMCKNHIPPPYVTLLSGHGILNTGVPGSTTSLNVDMIYLNDYNLLNVHKDEEEGPSSVGAALTNVAGSASSVTLLAANLSRTGATIFNDSTASLYVKFGSTASTTSFTVRLFTNDYYEVPAGYNGIITGIWASASGAARITELS